MRILLVEDDETVAGLVCDFLSKQHYVVDVAEDGEAGWELIEAYTYDLILLDVMLPKMDGMTLCRRIRSGGYRMPVLLLTARQTSIDKVTGLDVGADDYVVKPFDLKELGARIRALLRRGNSALAPVLQWGKLHLDPSTCEVTYENKIVPLSPKEYSLLELFLRNSRRIYSRRAILDHLWSWEDAPGEDTVKAHIKGLRQKFKSVGAPVDLIETVYGMGYRLKPLSKEQEEENLPLILAAGLPDRLTSWLQERLALPIERTDSSEEMLDELERGNWSLLLLDASAIDPTVARVLEQAYSRLKEAKQSIIYCFDPNLATNLPRKLIGQILLHPLDWEELARSAADTLGLTLTPAQQLSTSDLTLPIETENRELKLSNLPAEIIHNKQGKNSAIEDKSEVPQTEIITVNSEDPTSNEGASIDKLARIESLQSAVGGLWEKFKDKIINRIAVLEQASEALLAGTLNDRLREQAIREAHKLAGSLGTFGFVKGSSIAREIEELLQVKQGETHSHASNADEDRPLQKTTLSTGSSGLWSGLKISPAHEVNIMRLFQLVTALRRELEAASDANTTDTFPYAGWQSLLNNNKRRLLIIEPDRQLAEPLVREAVTWGMQVESLSNLSDAKVTIENSNPDLVLLDLYFGDSTENGLKLLKELSAQNPPVPVIILTSRDTFSDRVEVARMGGCAFLRKPIEPAGVMEAVSQVLQKERNNEFKVMAVDDDPQILSTLETILQPWGIKPISLDDSRRLWEVLEATAPDLLILDIDMPHVNGIEICKVIRNDPKWNYLPVLFLSSHTDAETIKRVFGVGADDYVYKPIIGSELIARIFNRIHRVRVLRSISETDILTGVLNRRKLMQDVQRFLGMCKRYGQTLSFAILDFDYFQEFNEEYGHAAGDMMLQRFGKLLLESFCSEDVVGRWADGKFAIGMYALNKESAAKRLSDLIACFQQSEFDRPEARKLQVHFSVGVAQYPDDGGDLQSLYHNAGKALDLAKAMEGDRITCYNLP
ncbi:response regulator [Aerosakkonema funiforme]|uniref:response regulator n=1 Tax=Aerosakkonema funiforme TaxID=1246630 RepID=UPI0035B7B189